MEITLQPIFQTSKLFGLIIFWEEKNLFGSKIYFRQKITVLDFLLAYKKFVHRNLIISKMLHQNCWIQHFFLIQIIFWIEILRDSYFGLNIFYSISFTQFYFDHISIVLHWIQKWFCFLDLFYPKYFCFPSFWNYNFPPKNILGSMF